MEVTKDMLETLRVKYPEGTRVILVSMDDEQAPPIGTCGNVDHIDDMGTIHIKWDTGSSLGVVPWEDEIEIVLDDERIDYLIEGTDFFASSITVDGSQAYVELSAHSPGGEDLEFTVWFDESEDDFLLSLKQLYEYFDADGHAVDWYESEWNHCGQIFGIQHFLDDAKDIEKMLDNLWLTAWRKADGSYREPQPEPEQTQDFEEISVDIGFANLVACSNVQADGLKEIIVGLRGKDGSYIQDLTVITGNEPEGFGFPDKTCRVRIFGDCCDEGWTDMFDIPMYEEASDEEM